MKKFSISTQLLILVLTILLSTSIVFIIITYFSLQKVASDQVYYRLDSFVNRPQNEDIEGSDNEGYDDMNTYYIKNDREGYHLSTYATDFITDEEFDTLLNSVLKQKSTLKEFKKGPQDSELRTRGIYRTNNGRFIYYSFKSNEEFTVYTFMFTDSEYVNKFTRDVALRMFTTFLGILFVAVMVIYYWSTRVTKRLKNIQYHIIDLPKDKYEKEYVDDSLDEIGELSRSVEDMRKTIGYNENTKQEMLQNVSHDFKTPIAVIKSYAEAYQDGMAGPEAIDTIIEQAEILKKKVNRLLQYNSLEYLTKDKPFEEINMTELVNRVVSNYRFQTKKDIILDLEDNVIFEGYQENWSTVIENILDNAKRYAKKEIRITLRNDYLKIFNDGENIEEQFLKSIFKPYEKGSKGQFGLGMSIVKKTVDFFGMNMSVRNESPTGVSFLIKKSESVE